MPALSPVFAARVARTAGDRRIRTHGVQQRLLEAKDKAR